MNPEMPLNRFGLQSKIIIIFAAVVVSVVGISTYLALLFTRQLVEEAIYRKVLSQALTTAHQLVNNGELDNPANLLARLRQVEHDFKGVEECSVYLHDPQHTLVATTNPTGQHLELDRILDVESYNEFERPDDDQITIESADGRDWIMSTAIRDQGRVVGCLDLAVSKKSSNAIIFGLVRRNLLLMLASLLAVMLAIHVFFLRNVRHPVKEMVRVMEAAEGGALEKRASVRSNDEIGQLAGHLNAMLGRL